MLRKLSSLNRNRILQVLQNEQGIIYLKSGNLQDRKWTDTEEPFRQESNFFYATGCSLAGYHLTIDIKTKKTILFIPDYPQDYVIWHGKPKTTESVQQEFGVDECLTVSQLNSVLKNYQHIHVLDNAELPGYQTNANVLCTAFAEARVIKNDLEIELMKKACDISCEAHIALMKAIKPGVGTELEYAAFFEYECRKRGARFQAYNAIIGGGLNPAVLHHYTNNDPFPTDPNCFVLVDAGCEYNCYASDITRTYPLGGIFTGDFKTIYEIVLDSNKQVIANIKPGVQWEDMHRLAELVILRGLVKAGIVIGDEKELIQNHIPALFFPHGLGHLLGLDVHDVGGYPFGVERIQEPGIRYLRMRRTLHQGMVVTVEPGIYFIDALLDPIVKDPKKSKFFNIPVLERFKRVGGVRIEDDVLVTASGTDVFSNTVPKEINEIELLMKH